MLVRVPRQPHLFIDDGTLHLFQAAERRLGAPLDFYDNDYERISPTWRPFAQQWTAWRKGMAGQGPIASNPFTGLRMHMRGGAGDLRRTDKAARDACRAVGLIPDPSEDWHWSDPRWTSMPIILTRPASVTATALLITNEDNMRNLYVNDKSIPADQRDIKVDATHWIHGAAGQYAVDKSLYGGRVKVSLKQAQKALADVNRARAQDGAKPITDPIIGS